MMILNSALFVGTIRSMIWRSMSMGISFLCLLLLASKLYDVDREIKLLTSITSDWIIPDNNSIISTPATSGNISVQVAAFRNEMNNIIAELWSSRATLLLSVVFVMVYILSWTWMSYTVREDKATEEMSMKTVLLLTVFTVVDIVASTGFIMVRVTMYILRNRHFPVVTFSEKILAEQNQLSALTLLRLTTLTSSAGTIDIFVSLIVGVLAIFRLNSVACACSFYHKNRPRLNSTYEKRSSPVMENMVHRGSHDSCNFLHRIPRLS